MSNFPLYDNLSAECENIDLTTKQKEKDAAGAKRSASRMKDTLRSLGGS